MLPFQTTSTLNKPEMIGNLENIEVSFTIQAVQEMRITANLIVNFL